MSLALASQSLPAKCFTPVSLTIPPGTPIKVWIDTARAIEVSSDAMRWWLGDLLLQGEAMYGEASSQILDEYNRSTLSQYRWIAKCIPVELRDERIPYAWYRDAARLPLETLSELVSTALADNWDYPRWREAVSEAKGQIPSTTGRKPRDVDGAILYASERVGATWRKMDTDRLAELLGA